MTDSDLTVSILREIRDSVRTLDTNLSTRIDRLDERLTSRIDVTNQRLEVVESRVSLLEHAVTEATAQILLLGRYVKNRTEVDVADLRERVARLEAKVG